MLQLLEHHDAGALTHHEPGPRRVERAAGAGGHLVLGGESPHRAEACEEERMDAALGAAGEHGVGGAVADEVGALADRVGAGRAGRDDGVVRPAQTERDRDLAARRVGKDVRQERGRHAARAALSENVVLAQQLVEPADTRAEHHPDAIGPVAVEPRVVHRLPGRGERELDAAIEALELLGGREAVTLEVLDLGCDVDRILARVERADEIDAAAPLHRSLPGGLHVVAERGDRSHAGDDDSPHPSSR